MRKIAFIAGAGIGFVLGSKAGPTAYQQLEANVRKLAGRPEVQDAVEQAKGKVADKLPTSNGSSSEPLAAKTSSAPEPVGSFETGAPITPETPVSP